MSLEPRTILSLLEADRAIMNAQNRADTTMAAMRRVREVTSDRPAKERAAERVWIDHVIESSSCPRIAPLRREPEPESRTQKIYGVILAVVIGALLAAGIAHWWAS